MSIIVVIILKTLLVSLILTIILYVNCLKVLKILILIFLKILPWVGKRFPMPSNIYKQIDDDLDRCLFQLRKKLKEKDLGAGKIFNKSFSLRNYLSLMILVFVFQISLFHIEERTVEEAEKVEEMLESINDGAGDPSDYEEDNSDQYCQVPEIKEDEKSGEEAENRDEYMVFHLGIKGYEGAYLRQTPEMKENNMIAVVFGDVELVYLHEMQETEGTIWLKISTEDIPEAWISTVVLDQDELEQAGIYKKD